MVKGVLLYVIINKNNLFKQSTFIGIKVKTAYYEGRLSGNDGNNDYCLFVYLKLQSLSLLPMSRSNFIQNS